MLAGRKLLLADDSISTPKVVSLTFADEGVNVLCVRSGREAIEQLEEFAPDIVLAAVFLPDISGYELCEYIKQNHKFKHIPVMLLVGSFEPFDEEEARRVGADETLTKPFQSIRRLIEKVGLLSSNRPPEEQIPTAELPHAEEPPVEKLTTAELEITTADTQPLPAELKQVVDEAAANQAREEVFEVAPTQAYEEVNEPAPIAPASSPSYESAGEVLLDLGDFKQGGSPLDDEFVLDIDLDEIPEPSPAEPAFSVAAFRGRESFRTLPKLQPSFGGGYSAPAAVVDEPVAATADPLARTFGYERIVDEAVEPAAVEPEQSANAVSPAATAQMVSAPASAQELSPEMIDAIARRAVEQLSEKVVQEIAWEVVPQLAELLIKRQLEEKNS
ncbi:MAG TPA: response regulator [Pyrinomonadaceae bacterium]|nr:response regulator [Pyrinomonadaceae bacterium]